MKRAKKLLRLQDAYKLMNRVNEAGKPIPFDIKFVTKEGHVDMAEQCVKVVSYNRITGMRRLVLHNGEFRNIYDCLILQIDETRIVVS